MADRENVIKGLEIQLDDLQKYAGATELLTLTQEHAKEILALLKEQGAVEPRKEDDGNPQPWTAWWHVCGDCGQEIEYHDRYCRWCGKAVKWE